jgi:exonuclease SbcD
VLLVSGNHDSAERLAFAGRLLAGRNIHLGCVFDGAPKHVTLADEYGAVHFWLLPFIKPALVRAGLSERGLSDDIESYDDAVAAALGSAEIDYAQRNVLVAHQFFVKTGVEPLRSESELSPVGGLDAVNAELISRFDYAALGHLHGAQPVGQESVRYAGSPLKYSLSEWRQEKSLPVVELRKKGDLTVRKLPLRPIHDLREIRGPLDRLTSAEVASAADSEDYLRVVLTDEEELVDPMGKLRSVYPRVMALDFENSRTVGAETTGSAGSAGDAGGAASLSPFDLFSQFFLETSGAVMSPDQEKIARELLEAAETEE